MRKTFMFALVSTLLLSYAHATDDKVILPPTFLTAHTVAVIIDPEAGVSLTDPNANQVARKDVEAALSNWGRFMPILSMDHADLIIVIRKGSGKLVNATINDPRQNNRAGVIAPTANGITIGAQQGKQSGGSEAGSPRPRTEVGGGEDSFLVYDGKLDHPTDGNPGWRYSAKDALHAHDVPAVEKFRAAIAEAEKAAAKAGSKKPPANSSPNTPNTAPDHP